MPVYNKFTVPDFIDWRLSSVLSEVQHHSDFLQHSASTLKRFKYLLAFAPSEQASPSTHRNLPLTGLEVVGLHAQGVYLSTPMGEGVLAVSFPDYHLLTQYGSLPSLTCRLIYIPRTQQFKLVPVQWLLAQESLNIAPLGCAAATTLSVGTMLQDLSTSEIMWVVKRGDEEGLTTLRYHRKSRQLKDADPLWHVLRVVGDTLPFAWLRFTTGESPSLPMLTDHLQRCMVVLPASFDALVHGTEVRFDYRLTPVSPAHEHVPCVQDPTLPTDALLALNNILGKRAKNPALLATLLRMSVRFNYEAVESGTFWRWVVCFEGYGTIEGESVVSLDAVLRVLLQRFRA